MPTFLLLKLSLKADVSVPTRLPPVTCGAVAETVVPS